MPSTNLHTLRQFEPHQLQEVVREATGQGTLQVTDFTVAVLSEQGVTSQDSLFLVQGHARTGKTREPWALVVKSFSRPEAHADPSDLLFLHREVEAYRSGLLTPLAAHLRAPRVYAVTEQGDQVWLWLEHVQETAGRVWTLGGYTHAAQQLGVWNGGYLTGRPLPEAPWLLRDLARQWSTMFGLASGKPSAQGSVFRPDLSARIERAWEGREVFLDMLRRLPQVFSHFDFHRRNLLRQGDDVIALDWAWCGLGPVGGDLVALIGSTCMFGEWDVRQIGALDSAVFGAYVAGLRQAGWPGDARLARLGYAAWMPLHFGVVAPRLVEFWTSEERQARAVTLFGTSPAELTARWSALCEWSLDRGDEAMALWSDLGREGATSPRTVPPVRRPTSEPTARSVEGGKT
ncbi:phosphotransferase [Deinococcus ficus]|nr:phosphotransferase [Deinococcus ficus]